MAVRIKGFWARYSAFSIVGAFFVGTILFLGGCDLREVIEVEKAFFEEPAAEAAGFLGYDEQDVKLTTCGNCHVGQQTKWRTSDHADAWAGLQDSGHAQTFCENCHAVSENGNLIEDDVAWASTQDARYHDVQCENCHGAGLQHVTNPTASQPVSQIGLGDVTDLSIAQSCAECHQGSHHPFAEQWATSGHSGVVGFAAGRDGCDNCHQGQKFLERIGVTANYVEKDSDEHLSVTCAVCHDPHGGPNEGQLRLPVRSVSLETNLCAQCHNRRTVPDPNSSHGLHPHAPEPALLLGEAGWFPPGLNIDVGQIIGTHGSVANEGVCASCHVNSFTVTDPATGDFRFQATGHGFNAIPCLDADGIPTQTTDCVITPEARSFDGCSVSGCHGTPGEAAQALASRATRIEDLAHQLHEQLLLVDPNGEGAGGAIDARNPEFTVAEGAYFNMELAEFGGDVYGSSTHNPYLTEALLVASIQAVSDAYGVDPPAGKRDWKAELQRIIDEAPQGLTAIPKGALGDAPMNVTLPMDK